MSIRAIVVDDEPLARRLIRELLEELRDIEIVGEYRNGIEALTTVPQLEPDLIFLDVQMPGLSGFDVIDRLGAGAGAGAGDHDDGGPFPYVIFVTAFDRYAIRAFEVQAIDYLLKPFTRERFRESIDRARAAIRERELGRIARRLLRLGGEYARARSSPASPFLAELRIRDGRVLRSIATAEVRWIEAANQYVRVHGPDGSHLLSRTLAALQKELDPQSFCRIHRSAIVNTAFVREVRSDPHGAYSVLLQDGTSLRLSRRRRGLVDELIRHRR